MRKLREIWSNKRVKFFTYSILYILLFVVWTGNLWMLPGLLIIYDVYISKIMYRLFWQKHKDIKKRNPLYRKTMEWVEAIVFAVVVTTFIKLFFFGMYVIPTPSMEKSLLVGDYLCVSRLAYGPAVPNTPIAFPLVHNTMPFSEKRKSYVEWIKWPYHRLKGFGRVERGDVVVFNFPAGDTVMLENQSVTYYDYLRNYQSRYGMEKGREKLYSDYTITSRPVDKRENYVKRCVGLPGDSIEVVMSELFVNGEPLGDIAGKQLYYFIQTDGTPISKNAFEEMGMSGDDINYNPTARTYTLPLTKENHKRVSAMRNVTGVVQYVSEGVNQSVFPHDQRYRWSEDNFGPLWVPSKGTTVKLSPNNISLFRSVIENYELHSVEVQGEQILIDGVPTDSYTFAMDYFFMMGDNRHNSADSRFWGFVPEDHIVGRASFIWMSTDAEKGRFPFNIRWSRLFNKVK